VGGWEAELIVTLLSGAATPTVGAPLTLATPESPNIATFAFNLVNAAFYGTATIYGSLDGQLFNPILAMNNNPGSPEPTSSQIAISADYLIFRASLDSIIPGQGAAATITMTY
jgi:hypothetical protein